MGHIYTKNNIECPIPFVWVSSRRNWMILFNFTTSYFFHLTMSLYNTFNLHNKMQTSTGKSYARTVLLAPVPGGDLCSDRPPKPLPTLPRSGKRVYVFSRVSSGSPEFPMSDWSIATTSRLVRDRRRAKDVKSARTCRAEPWIFTGWLHKSYLCERQCERMCSARASLAGRSFCWFVSRAVYMRSYTVTACNKQTEKFEEIASVYQSIICSSCCRHDVKLHADGLTVLPLKLFFSITRANVAITINTKMYSKPTIVFYERQYKCKLLQSFHLLQK